MAYDFGGDDLRAQPQTSDSGPDAMSGMANLADVMLVFACGLMLALVSYWNLDLPSITELDSSELQELNSEERMQDIVNSANAYIEKGTVYQDPATGKLYWMIETDAEGRPIDSNASSGNANSGNASSGNANSGGSPDASRAQGAD
jgi:hypothetical protein